MSRRKGGETTFILSLPEVLNSLPDFLAGLKDAYEEITIKPVRDGYFVRLRKS